MYDIGNGIDSEQGDDECQRDNTPDRDIAIDTNTSGGGLAGSGFWRQGVLSEGKSYL